MAVTSLNLDKIKGIAPQYQKQANLAVTILLSLYLLWFAAELIWKLVPTPEQAKTSVGMTTTSVSRQTSQSANIGAIQRLNLFGELGKEPVKEEPVVQDAPETNLQLTLTGLVASTNSQDGAAIIEHRGSQNTYGIGDAVDGTRATVHEVFADRIIINNGGRMETLMLDGVEFEAAVQAQTANRPTTVNTNNNMANRPASASRRAVEEMRTLNQESAVAAQQLRTAPNKFTDFIAIQPHRAEGKIVGYRVNPGRDPALFQAAGLQANDVLTEINGLDLTDIKQSMEAMKMLRGADALQLTVSRKGDLMTLNLELPEP